MKNLGTYRETESHIYFWGSFMSNFWLAPTTCKIEDIDYQFICSESAYMAFKAFEFKDATAFHDVLQAPDAKAAKAVGRRVINFDPIAWDKVSYDYMFAAVYAKFSQNDYLKEALLATGSKTLVEASPIDKIWGVGLHSDDDAILDEKNWTGENRLGKVLMAVRGAL